MYKNKSNYVFLADGSIITTVFKSYVCFTTESINSDIENIKNIILATVNSLNKTNECCAVVIYNKNNAPYKRILATLNIVSANYFSFIITSYYIGFSRDGMIQGVYDNGTWYI